MQRTHEHVGSGNKSLWVLPLVAALLPAAAAVAAYLLSIALGIVPACNPFIDGCVSISRAARHDLPNHVFRALVLPAAALQGLTWLLCAPWLRGLGAEYRAMLRVLPWLGVFAAICIVLYGTFLGTEGDAYRWLRRYGVNLYFGFTYLCMLILSGELRRLTASGNIKPPVRLDRLLLLLCVLALAMGLAQEFLPRVMGDDAFKNRLQNAVEWHVGLAFTLFFLALAWLWRHTRFTARLASSGHRDSTP